MITLNFVYWLTGLFFAAFALLNARDTSNRRRFGNAAFWGLLALSMLAGSSLGDFGNGLLVLALVGIAGFGGLGRSNADMANESVRQERAEEHGNRLFLLALIIPATALVGTLVFKQFPALFEIKQVTLISLALGVVLALAIGMTYLRAAPLVPLQEGRRLMDSVGWAAILPQMLASLGAVFALAGVGDMVGGLIQIGIPAGSLLGAVIAYALGMALFTVIMGNAFAAFPVMLTAIGMPLLIHQHHGNPAIICAIGMLAGFCGTLLTPMAANFNLVPAALLELKDQNGVIKAQVGTAIPLLIINTALIYWLAF
jgi:uncharacterized membrane protein